MALEETAEDIKKEIIELEKKAEVHKPLKVTTLEEARGMLERDFLVQGPSGIVYKIDMCNQAAYARLMSKMEGSDRGSITTFVVQNMMTLGKDVLSEIILEPKVGEDGISADRLPPSDITIIIGAFFAGPTAAGEFIEEDESFREQ